MTSYRLPFDKDGVWEVWAGNWDDPKGGHGSGQAYAFDFVGAEGQEIRAVRAGTVIEAASDRSCNIWGLTEEDKDDPCYGAPGEGNFVLIRHGDGTVAAYNHLKKDTVYVKNGEYVLQGKIIALSGNTGNSSTPHLHFGVCTFWNSASDLGPSIPVTFQDANHSLSWRPMSGNTLASNNDRERQDGWRLCNRCKGLFFGDNPGSKCPAPGGGAHIHLGSGNFVLEVGAAMAGEQGNWRWCRRCQGLFFGGNQGSKCPAAPAHDTTGGTYALRHNAPGGLGDSDGWRWCKKCQGLWYGGVPGPGSGGTPGSDCPATGEHTQAGSGRYTLAVDHREEIQTGWRRCSKCQGLFRLGGACPAGDPNEQHDESGSADYVLVRDFIDAPGQEGWRSCRQCGGLWFTAGQPSQCPEGGEHDKIGSYGYRMVHEYPGQADWHWCGQCQGLFFAGHPNSECPDGGPHANPGGGGYILTEKSSTSTGEEGWRWCRNCQALWFGGNPAAPCPAGGQHSKQGSGNYVLAADQKQAPGQPGWRRCKNCQVLWFSGNPGSVCKEGAGTHDASGSSDYKVVPNPGPGEVGWAWCRQCQGMFFGDAVGSVCPVGGGPHTKQGSGVYTIIVQRVM